MSDISILVEALHLGDCEWDGNYHCEIHDSRWLSSYERCVSVIDDLDIAERAIELVVPILTDLIAAIQDPDTGKDPGCPDCDYVGACQPHFAGEVEHAADRAQSLLKGLNDE